MLGQFESSREGCEVRTFLGEMLLSILHLVLTISVQHRIWNSFGNNFSV